MILSEGFALLIGIFSGIPFGLIFGLILGSARIGLATGILFGAGVTIVTIVEQRLTLKKIRRVEKALGLNPILRQSGFIISQPASNGGQTRVKREAAFILFQEKELAVISPERKSPYVLRFDYDDLGRDRETLQKGLHIILREPEGDVDIFSVPGGRDIDPIILQHKAPL